MQRPGRFWGAGAVRLPLLDLRVEGVGRLGLPIVPEQAQALVAAGVPAPYGKGPHTVVDEAVRRCRQLAPAAVHLDPRRWPPLLDAVVAEARQALGVDAPVTAELYKLLVYQPGDFFLPHRDSEKAPGMFATLVVSLPCEHTGGALHIEHGGEAAEVSLTDADLSQLHWVAFYTDCLHALKPIEGGHRVVLVYNLIGHKKKAPRPPEYTAEQTELAALLRVWPTEPAAPPLLVFPLAHRYSSAELGWATLKNEDAARAAALRAAAAAGGCLLRLGMVEIEEQGAATETWEPDRWRRRSRWREPPPSSGPVEFEVIEVHERSEQVVLCAEPGEADGSVMVLPLITDQLVPPNALDAEPADEAHYHEATGNEGATFERTYRRAAWVLWPAANHLTVLIQIGPDAVAAEFSRQMRDTDTDLVETEQLAQRLLTHLKVPVGEGGWGKRQRSQIVEPALRALVRLPKRALLRRLVAEVAMPHGLSGLNTHALALALIALADDDAGQPADPEAQDSLEAQVQTLVRRAIAGVGDETPGPDGIYPSDTTSRCSAAHTDVAMFLLALHAERPGPWLRPTAAWLVGVISEDTEARAVASGMGPHRRASIELVRPYLPLDHDWLVELIGVLSVLGAFDLIAEALHRTLARPAVYGIDEVVLPAVRTHLVQATPALRAALEPARAACEAHLRARIALPLEPPVNHERSIEGLDCRCSFCHELRLFMASPTTREAVFAINQDARNHLVNAIKQAKAEVRTRVVEQGRPYKLVCTKNQRRYDERVAQRAHDLDNLSRLLTAGHPRT